MDVEVHSLEVGNWRSVSSLAGKEVPEREWLVPNMIPMHTVTLFSGDGGTGKSLLAMQLACAVASGDTWLDRSVRGGSALYISAEDDEDELHRRFAAIGDLSRYYRLQYRSLAGENALLASEYQGELLPTELFHELRSFAEGYSLIVLDTLADFFGSNENDRAKVRQFVGMLRNLAMDAKAAVVLLSHPSLNGLASGNGLSGSTAWNNSVRSRLYLERVKDDGYESDPNARILSTKKANYAASGAEIAMTWQDGVFVADPQETGLDRMSASAKAERVFLKLLDEFNGDNRRVRHSTGDGYAPNAFVKSGRNEGVSKRALASAMESLFAKGAIKVAEEGPPSRRTRYLDRGEI